MSYINALKEISEYVDANWTATPVVYVNAPQPIIPSTGQYAGCYIRIYGAPTTTEVELSESKRRLEQGLMTLDIHVPDDRAYLVADELTRLALPLFNNLAYNSVKAWVTEVNQNAGYFDDGTHVCRISIDYICDYDLV